VCHHHFSAFSAYLRRFIGSYHPQLPARSELMRKKTHIFELIRKSKFKSKISLLRTPIRGCVWISCIGSCSPVLCLCFIAEMEVPNTWFFCGRAVRSASGGRRKWSWGFTLNTAFLFIILQWDGQRQGGILLCIYHLFKRRLRRGKGILQWSTTLRSVPQF